MHRAMDAYAMVDDFDLDMAFGGENDFELSIPLDMPQPTPGGVVAVAGTEYGGIVDRVGLEVKGGSRKVKYNGRTWHGVLEGKVIEPDRGRSHLTVEGDANKVIATMLDRMGLLGTFTVPAGESGLGIKYTFERYVDGYTGLRAMLASSGAVLGMRLDGDAVVLSAERRRTFDGEVYPELVDFSLTRDDRPVNHLVGLGSGQLEERVVCHWYADVHGRVSQSQSLFGVDERAAVYDYNNADAEELSAATRDKLVEMQSTGTVSVDVCEGLDARIGDIVVGVDAETSTRVAAEVVKKILNVDGGVPVVDCEVGTASATSSLSGSAESSNGGGHAYSAGRGLTLTGYTFSAEVAAEDLDAVRAIAEDARREASDASAAAASCVRDVTGAAPATASRSGSDVEVGVEVCGAADANEWFSN